MSSQPQPVLQPQLSLVGRLSATVQVFALKAITAIISQVRSSNILVNHKKTYQCRPYLPVHIFIPPTYSSNSTSKLPTLFTIHGGGFTLGSPADDDDWNRSFTDKNDILTIGLNYSKAPLHPFPAAIHDLEALIIEIIKDCQLPVDLHRCAIAGFSGGGNLALAVAQSQSISAAFAQLGSAGLTAAIPIYPGLDRSIPRELKANQRRYKFKLTPNRNGTQDYLLKLGNLFEWSYIPVGQDLRDPLISPIFAERKALPQHIFMIACELDLGSHDAWRMACRLGGRPEPDPEDKVGRDETGTTGELELDDERFAWQDKEMRVKWLLIPDVVHAFDRLTPSMLGDETSVRDAHMKSAKVIQHIGDWLWKDVWGP